MQRLYFITTLVAITVVSALNVFFNYQIAWITDSLTEGNHLKFEQNILAILFVMGMMLLTEFVRQVCNQRFLNRVGYQIQATILGRILHGPGLIKQSEIASHISAIHNDSEMIKELHYETIFSLYQGLISFLFAGWALLSLDRQVALAVFLLTLIPIGLPYIFRGKMSQVQEGISREKASYQVLLNDILSGLLVIKNSGLGSLFLGKAENQYEAVNKMEDRRAVLKALLNVLTGFFFYLLTIVILYLGGRQILAGEMTVGALVAIYSIALELTMPINLIASSLSDIASVRSIRQKLLHSPSIYEEKPILSDKFETLEVANLSYEIEEKLIFNDINLVFRAGKKYLIQGESGVGKSTLAYLLSQQLENVEGVYLNGQPITHFNYDAWQSYMTFLPQQVKLFHDSIWNNLTFGRAASEAEVEALVHLFGLADRFPNKEAMESEVFDAASTLSGGQQQRVALIRGILAHKPILVLDESLSGLDDETFAVVEQALLNLQNITLLHISHRSLHPADYDEIITLGE